MRDLNRNIGSFMVAVGAVIELKDTDKILVMLRDTKEIHHGKWELMYGRIGHHEELETALQREIQEETGLSKIKVKNMQRVWHIYRGEKHEDTETYGFTFVCESEQENVQLSAEHGSYKWVTPEEALTMVSVSGIKQDIEIYIKNKKEQRIYNADINGNLNKY